MPPPDGTGGSATAGNPHESLSAAPRRPSLPLRHTSNSSFSHGDERPQPEAASRQLPPPAPPMSSQNSAEAPLAPSFPQAATATVSQSEQHTDAVTAQQPHDANGCTTSAFRPAHSLPSPLEPHSCLAITVLGCGDFNHTSPQAHASGSFPGSTSTSTSLSHHHVPSVPQYVPPCHHDGVPPTGSTSCIECSHSSCSSAGSHSAAAPLVMTRQGADVSTTGSLAHVPHCQQRFNWDCGLACVLMVVQAVGVQCSYETLRQLCSTTSTWTVDLAHLLRRLVPPHLRVSMFTVTLGPNPAYADEHFYANLVDDELRVARLFADAKTAGIAVEQRSLDSTELQSLLVRGDHLVIALVDKRKLDSRTEWLMGADACLPTLCGGTGMGYAGHFIVLVGFDAEACQFLVRDPASHVADLRMSAVMVDQARRSFGTDEDLLVVGLAEGC